MWQGKSTLIILCVILFLTISGCTKISGLWKNKTMMQICIIALFHAIISTKKKTNYDRHSLCVDQCTTNSRSFAVVAPSCGLNQFSLLRFSIARSVSHLSSSRRWFLSCCVFIFFEQQMNIPVTKRTSCSSPAQPPFDASGEVEKIGRHIQIKQAKKRENDMGQKTDHRRGLQFLWNEYCRCTRTLYETDVDKEVARYATRCSLHHLLHRDKQNTSNPSQQHLGSSRLVRKKCKLVSLAHQTKKPYAWQQHLELSLRQHHFSVRDWSIRWNHATIATLRWQ